MALTPLAPNDSRVEHKFATVAEGTTYHYMLAKPDGEPAATVLLLHGWPDLGLGWRFQVPYLLSRNLQVIVPDMLGYGQTTAPDFPASYSLKTMSGHLASLINDVTSGSPVILGGHDWGAILAWRFAIYHPELIRAIFSFCIPFMPPLPVVVSLEQAVERVPQFKYQLQLASGVAEAIAMKSRAHLSGFLRSCFGAVTAEGLPGFDVSVGLVEERLETVGASPLVGEDILDFYVQEYSRNGLHGPMNWYRTRLIVGEEELPLARTQSPFRFSMPAMIVMAGQDPALPPSLADGQEEFFPAGLKKEVIEGASHWVLIHCPEEVNQYIGEFLSELGV
ncbi:alpha/beta-hydrolase [Aspergillus varians]